MDDPVLTAGGPPLDDLDNDVLLPPVPDHRGCCRVFGEALLPILFYELVVALSYPASAARPPSTTHAFLGSKPLRLFADISLAVYVVHQTLIVYMTLAAYGVLWPGAFGTNGALMLMPKWGAAATLPLSIVLGWLLTYGFERPLRRALKRAKLEKYVQAFEETGYDDWHEILAMEEQALEALVTRVRFSANHADRFRGVVARARERKRIDDDEEMIEIDCSLM